MTLQARLYLAIITALGSATLLSTLLVWSAADGVRFLSYLAVALAGSTLKVRLPGVTGTMSVNFFFVLLGVIDLSLPETMVIACSATLVQIYWGASKRPGLVQVAFNLASIAIAVTLTDKVYRSPMLLPLQLNGPLALAATACSYFVANTFPVAIVIALTERKPLRMVWRQCYLWSFAYYLVGAAMAGIFARLNQFWGWQASLLALPLVYMGYHSYRLYLERLESQKRHAEDQQRHAEQMAGLHLRTIEALALAIEAKDQTTHDHLARVQVYALEIGRELKLSQTELDALQAASLLHDIGKLAVPEHIISKPGRLTPEEFEKMKIHPVVGAEILERVGFPYPVVPIVRSHHEKWDGTGYPDGLQGEQIPLGARILAAVDCLDALASDRQYRRALPLDEAMQRIVSDSGKHFDPCVVEVLQRGYVAWEAQATGKRKETARLSTDIKVERGDAPAAGFATELPPTPATQKDFLASIAAARHEAQALFELSQELGNSLSLGDTLSMMAGRLKRLVPHDGVVVWLLRGEFLEPEHVSGDDARLFSSLRIPAGQGLSGWVAENRLAIINGNPSVEPGYLNDPNRFSTLRSALAVPLEGTDGVVGVLTLYSSPKDAFTRDHLRVLQAVSSKLAISVENTLKYRQAEDSATTDYLTGLPNARSLFLHLEQETVRCRAQGLPLTVMVCDLDGFKQVNDRLGHLEGNRVLTAVACHLKLACRQSDYVARMGGDEFVLVLPEVGRQETPELEERFRQAAERAGLLVCGERMISLSVGQANLSEDGCNAERLLAEADKQMYRAKQESKRRRSDSTPRTNVIELAEALQNSEVVVEVVQ